MHFQLISLTINSKNATEISLNYVDGLRMISAHYTSLKGHVIK